MFRELWHFQSKMKGQLILSTKTQTKKLYNNLKRVESNLWLDWSSTAETLCWTSGIWFSKWIHGILANNFSFEYKNSVAFPFMYLEQQYHSVDWKQEGKERKKGSATQRIYLSDSCPLVWFHFFFLITVEQSTWAEAGIGCIVLHDTMGKQ